MVHALTHDSFPLAGKHIYECGLTKLYFLFFFIGFRERGSEQCLASNFNTWPWRMLGPPGGSTEQKQGTNASGWTKLWVYCFESSYVIQECKVGVAHKGSMSP